jgi:hypothetical protein
VRLPRRIAGTIAGEGFTKGIYGKLGQRFVEEFGMSFHVSDNDPYTLNGPCTLIRRCVSRKTNDTVPTEYVHRCVNFSRT